MSMRIRINKFVFNNPREEEMSGDVESFRGMSDKARTSWVEMRATMVRRPAHTKLTVLSYYILVKRDSRLH